MWRLAQLERSLSNPKHDYAKFGTGNKQTLLDDAKVCKILKFFQVKSQLKIIFSQIAVKRSGSSCGIVEIPFRTLQCESDGLLHTWQRIFGRIDANDR